MKTTRRPPRPTSGFGGLRGFRIPGGLLAGLSLFAAVTLFAAGRVFLPYSSAKPVLDEQRDHLPAALRNADEPKWAAWARQRDEAIRARLEQGDLDSMVNLLLYGTSFTQQPRIRMESLTEASKSGLLRARVDDLAAGLRRPGDNQRLQFLQRLVRRQGVDPEAADGLRQTGAFLYKHLLRVLEERKTLAARAVKAESAARPNDPSSLLDRASLFGDRGLSLDTGILPDFTIEQTLRDLKKRGVLREGRVARVAVIGPGLDFIDKNEEAAFDYYPEQTLQPFALYDSLARLELARAGGPSISVLDISSRVIEHLQNARERARKGAGYVIQLPRDVARPWPPDVIAYWNSMGDRAGTAIAPIRPPEIFPDLPTRAVRIRPEVVLSCEPVDLDIVLQSLDFAEADRFDLMVATNVFVYYDAFEQALALRNAAAMLKPGGLLLTNDRLPVAAHGSMRLAGVTEVRFDVPGLSARQAVGWYRKDERSAGSGH